jgi:hypothetical protein
VIGAYQFGEFPLECRYLRSLSQPTGKNALRRRIRFFLPNQRLRDRYHDAFSVEV